MDPLTLSWTEWALWSSLVLLGLYKLGTWKYDLFSKQGVKHLQTVPFFGSIAAPTLRLKSFAYMIEDTCKLFRGERMVGLFMFSTPFLVVKEPELIKRVTVKDFDHFMDHVQMISETTEPLFTKNLFALRGEKWRVMRNTLSPAFTSSKMRNMFTFMNDCGKQLADYLQEEVDKQDPGKPYVMEMKETFTRFTNDVIATSAFGIHIDSLKDKNNTFYTMGRKLTDFSGIKSVKFLAITFAPRLCELLGISVFSKTEHEFFQELIIHTVTTREKEGIVRPDMIHLLMQARHGELRAEEGEEEEQEEAADVKSKKTKLSMDDIAAQALIFFFAGFDTASTLLSFAAILLATHEDVQRRLQDEVDEAVGGDHEVSYDKVLKMKYLDMVLAETLRMYPPNMSTDRQCTKMFVIPASDSQPAFTLRPGDRIMIPTYGLHHDPDYFPDPEKFDPERFSEENKHKIQPYTYLPFGVGPRLCIGQRFALLEAKAALTHILSRFELIVVEETPLPLRLTPKGFSMAVDGGFWVGALPRQKPSS